MKKCFVEEKIIGIVIILTCYAALMMTYSIFTQFKLLNIDSTWADIGFYALSFILTLALYLVLWLIGAKNRS